MKKDLVSIILCSYNGEKYISKAISSVLGQTYWYFELIIINDASIDSTEDIILSYKKNDTRIIYIKNKKNLEKSISKNKAIEKSKGKYIAFIDDDDSWHDINKLKKQMDFLKKNKKYWLVWTNAITVNENNNIIWKIIVKPTDQAIKNNILLTNQFIQSSVIIKKDIFLLIGWFNKRFNICEDYDLWLRAGQMTKMANIQDFTVRYMIRKTSTTWKNSYQMKKKSLELIKKYQDFYPYYYRAIIIRCFTFFIPLYIITRLRKASKTKI